MFKTWTLNVRWYAKVIISPTGLHFLPSWPINLLKPTHLYIQFLTTLISIAVHNGAILWIWFVDAVEKSPTGSAKPRDCSEIYNSGRRVNGVYTLHVGTIQEPVQIDVYCNMTTDGGGWTVCIDIYCNTYKQLVAAVAHCNVVCYSCLVSDCLGVDWKDSSQEHVE